MATKLAKDTYPENGGPADFQCFGPPATKDGQFDQAKIADLGCFTQDGKDTNKYYHAAIVQHRKSKRWYAYYEWGRTGAARPSFQFVQCSDESDAQRAFASQLHSKNDRRGEWADVAGIRTLRAKKGKDCYLVRAMATRSTGLPDARSIKFNDGDKPGAKSTKKTKADAKKANAPKKTKVREIDAKTRELLRDLSVATIAYTRGSMADESLPTQAAINEARTILSEAQKRLINLGDNVKKQLKDRELLELTNLMFGRIPKKKPLNAPPQDWILSQDNVLRWQNDLDAFESALDAVEDDTDDHSQVDPLAELGLKMRWIAKSSSEGKSLYRWWPKATANRHSYIGDLKILNLWEIERDGDRKQFSTAQQQIIKSKVKPAERALFQPRTRVDFSTVAEKKRYKESNTALLFHGTRSVNVRGIMKESLRMPKTLVGVVITGAMFGPGLYFADDWKKSAGYTSLRNSYWSRGSGSIQGRGAFMFAMDVALGNPFVAPHAHGYTGPPDGHHCVFGKAGESGVQNNEYIIFDAGQQQIRYLIEFEV